LSPVNASNGTCATCFLSEFLDVDAAHVSERHARRAELGRVGYGEIDLMLGGHPALEGHPVRLGYRVAMAVLDEIEALLLGKRAPQIGSLADQAGLAFLPHASLEQRFDEDELVAVDEVLDLIFGRAWAQDFRRWKIDVRQHARAVEHSGDVHCRLRELERFPSCVHDEQENVLVL
jgi:hypothetical protein